MIKNKGKYSHLTDTEYLYGHSRNKYNQMLYPDAMKAKFDDATSLHYEMFTMKEKDDDDVSREFYVRRAVEWAYNRVNED